jgi:predicted permease
MMVVFFLHFPLNQSEIRTLLMISVLGPPAVMNVSFALYFKLDTKFAAISVAVVTLIAIGLLPFMVWFGQSFF